MAGILEKINKFAENSNSDQGIVAQNKKDQDQMVKDRTLAASGLAKTVVGGVGSVPSAVGSSIAYNIPKAIGMPFGLEPTPQAEKDYSQNAPLDMAKEGIGELGSAVTGMVKRNFDLQPVSPPMGRPVSAPAAAVETPKIAPNVSSPPSRIPDATWADVIKEANIQSPDKVEAAAATPAYGIHPEISKAIKDIKDNKSLYNTDGSLKAGAQWKINELIGHGVTSDTQIQSAKLRKGELDEIARGTLVQHTRANDLLHQDLQLKLSEQRDKNRAAATQSFLNSVMVKDVDSEGKEIGGNLGRTYLRLIDQDPNTLPEEIRPGVAHVRNSWDKFVLEVRKKNKNITPLIMQEARKDFDRSLAVGK